MSYKKLMTKKQWILYPLLLFFFLLLTLGIAAFTNDEAKFNSLSRELFKSELSNNALNLHYTLAYPENYGLEGKVSLPVYTGKTDPSSEKEELLTTLSALTDIDKDKLNARDAYTYDLLQRHLTRSLKGTDFPYYSEPFSPNSGIQSGLPILLADYTFRHKDDIEDYLDILEQTEDYLGGLLQYEKEKADAGLFMADYSAQKVIEQCCAIMDKESLSAGNHFLHTTFEERLKPLLEKGELSQEEAENYISENDRLLTCIMQPAYEQIADTFTLLLGKGTNEQGLAAFKQGREYYTNLLAATCGSDRPIAEIKQILFADFKENYNALITLLSTHPQLADSAYTASLDLPLSTPEEMLTSLKKRMAQDFPAFPAEEDFQAGLILKKVSTSMEEYSSPAYYLTPPIDDMTGNIIYINGRNDSDHLGLYTTLAHEGYPGHLYQTVYSQLVFNKNEDSLIRSLLHYGGFVEGWAYYVEDLSYSYAKELASDDLSSAYYEACRLNRNIHLCMYSLLDIAIHYDGASLSQVQEMLKSIGVTNENSVTAVYQYVVEEPVNYLKYYLGFLEMKMLKEDATASWGENFSLYRFHQFLLETGPSDFAGLHEELKKY